VTLLELHMATAIHEWSDEASGAVRYAAESPGPTFADAGVKFYASVKPAPGLAPLYGRVDGGYSFEQRLAGDTPAFFAYTAPPDGPVATIGVVEVVDGTTRRLVAGGDGDPVFYVPCARRSCEESPPTP
jgi:hypothetical protein